MSIRDQGWTKYWNEVFEPRLRELVETLREFEEASAARQKEIADEASDFVRLLTYEQAAVAGRLSDVRDDWEAARASLQPLMSDPLPREAALDALAAVRLESGDAAACLRRAAELAADQPTSEDLETQNDLAVAYAILGEYEAAATHWRSYLEEQDSTHQKLASVFARTHLGEAAAASPEIVEVNMYFEARSAKAEEAD